MGTTSDASGGIGLATALALLFIGLKLGGVISWSWWWVLSPLWISWAIALFMIFVVLVIMAVRR
jgi:hypothetical protein